MSVDLSGEKDETTLFRLRPYQPHRNGIILVMQLKRLSQSELARKLSIWTISTLLLFFAFFSNSWHVAEQQWFGSHQRDTESLIVGRMVKSRQDGIFSAGGLTGAGMLNDIQQGWVSSEQIQNQYSAYLYELTFDGYSPYMSQIGGQGILFSLLDRLIPLSSHTKLQLFYMLTSLLSAIALTVIVHWFYREFGWWVAISVVGSMVLSQWLTVFGRNLWWSLWAFYLPMIAVMYFLRHYKIPANRQFVTFGIVILISVFVKCFINGYEYITTTLVMMMVPFIYYAIVDRWRVPRFLKLSLATVSGSCVAIFLSLALLCFQIGSVKGGFGDGVAHVVYSLGKRTHGEADSFPPQYAASLKAGTIEVVTTYIEGTFFEPRSQVSRSLFKVRYVHLIVVFIMMSVLLFVRGNEKRRQHRIALICATWFSILAPLSWYVIFKAHSFIHTHMSYLLWQMPFTFFGFAICGWVLKNAFSDLIRLTARLVSRD